MDALIKKHYIYAATSLLIVIALTIAVLRFADGMKERTRKVTEIRDRIASFDQNRKLLNQESKELQDIKSEVESLEGYLVTEADIPNLLSELESYAKKDNVQFDITSVQNQVASETTPKKLTIDFTAEGSFAKIESLVDQILSQPYQVKFVRFALYSIGGVQSEPSLVGSGSSSKSSPSSPSARWNLVAGIEILSF